MSDARIDERVQLLLAGLLQAGGGGQQFRTTYSGVAHEFRTAFGQLLDELNQVLRLIQSRPNEAGEVVCGACAVAG